MEGDAATPWLLTMLPGPFSTESWMSALLYAAVQRVQQQCPALGGRRPMAWKKQLLSPPGNPWKSRRGAPRFAPSC
jgi:hypothetical protein